MSYREQKGAELRRIAGFAVSGLVILAGSPALALECPLPHPAGTLTAIEQTAEDVRTYAELLAAQGTGVVPEIVSQLRKAHPGATAAEIVNVLVAVYWPVVKGNASPGEGQKRARLTAFSSRLMQESTAGDGR